MVSHINFMEQVYEEPVPQKHVDEFSLVKNI